MTKKKHSFKRHARNPLSLCGGITDAIFFFVCEENLCKLMWQLLLATRQDFVFVFLVISPCNMQLCFYRPEIWVM